MLISFIRDGIYNVPASGPPPAPANPPAHLYRYNRVLTIPTAWTNTKADVLRALLAKAANTNKFRLK